MTYYPYTNQEILEALESSPVAGGNTYNNDVTRSDADIIVSTGAELDSALSNGYRTIWCDADYIHLANRQVEMRTYGQTIAGDRGINGSEGPILYSNSHGTDGISVHANNCRITGVRLQGPEYDVFDDPEYPGFVPMPDSSVHGPSISERRPFYNYYASCGIDIEDDNCEVDNCEIYGWGDMGIAVSQSGVTTSGTHIHHNYIHDTMKDSMGYCVEIFTGARPLIEYNYMNAARHAVAGFGTPTSSYVIRKNVFGPTNLSFVVDQHNQGENSSGSSSSYYSSGWTYNAGYNMEVNYNTFFVTGVFYESDADVNRKFKDSWGQSWTLQSRAHGGNHTWDIRIRGVPWPRTGNGLVARRNEFLHDGPQSSNSSSYSSGNSLYQTVPSAVPSSHRTSQGWTHNIHFDTNRYNIENKPYDPNYGTEIAMDGSLGADFTVEVLEEGTGNPADGVDVTILRE